MKDIWDQLDLFGPVLSCSEDTMKFNQYQEKERVKQFLRALHEDYEPARASLLRRGNLPKIESVVVELLSKVTPVSICENQESYSAEVLATAPITCHGSTAANDNQSVGDSSSSTLPATTGGAITIPSIKKIHQSHLKHPLEKVNLGIVYTCDGCKMQGIGWRYRCHVCNFDLHEECMLAAETPITFQGNECQFLEKPPLLCQCGSPKCHRPYGYCDACGMEIKGFANHCAENKKYFHPRCARLDSEIPCDNVKFRLQEGRPSKCRFCGKRQLKGATNSKKTGWSYVCVSEEGCDFHVYCFMEFLAKLKHSSQNSTLTEKHLSSALVGTVLTPKTISKTSGGGNRGKSWLKILTTFFNAVFSILLGDPTTFIVPILAQIVTTLLQAG